LYDIDFKTSEIKKYLKKIKIPENTLEIIKSKEFTLIDDTYNLSENGLLA
jgi:UDP-N-acetylmuramyl pentapeptide synthase